MTTDHARSGALALTTGHAAGDLKVAARNAWLWGLPLIEMAEQRSARSTEGVKVNTFQHQRELITAKRQFVTTPNNDTLYSQAWLNLIKGPVRISVPASGQRYFSVALMDMYSNNFAVIGTRTCGDSGTAFTVVGPGEANADPMAVRSPTNWVWLLGRTLVDGQDDLATACAFQDGWSITGPACERARTYAPRTAPWSDYFAALQELMNESPPPVTDGRMLDSMAPLIAPGRHFDAARFSAGDADRIRAGIEEARKLLGGARGPARDGWTSSRNSLGNFGQDYDYRAAVAIGGLAALPRVEAMYLRGGGEDGSGFDSGISWRLSFRAEQLPPVDAFWSLSMYKVTPAQQLFFAENPIDRYAIGDRTPGLRRGRDGSLDILMCRSDPGENHNWLPTPADGKFVLSLRAYLPKPEMIEGLYRPPRVQPL